MDTILMTIPSFILFSVILAGLVMSMEKFTEVSRKPWRRQPVRQRTGSNYRNSNGYR